LNEYSEEQLIDLSVNGDLNAFEEIVRRHEKKIFAVAFRLSGNRQEGEDLAQEAFIRAWRGLANFRKEASLETWLVTIVTNLWRDRMRKNTLPVESLDEPIYYESGEVYNQVADDKPGPEEIFDSKEVQEYLACLINNLKPEFRLALVLRDIHGYSYEEIARMTDSTLGTVKSRINRARNYLREQILLHGEQSEAALRLQFQKASVLERRGSVDEK